MNTSNNNVDRLSGLSDELLIKIVGSGSLPMKEVVRTTILSKRWNNLWTETQNLYFLGHSSEFVDQALKLLRGGLVKSAAFSFSDESWLRWAIERRVEKLLLYGSRQTDILYACSSLENLTLFRCVLQNPQGEGNVQWNQLRFLMLEKCDHDADMVNQIVRGSPKLELLALRFGDSDGVNDFSIESTSLKKLWMDRDLLIENEDGMGMCFNNPYTELTISTPNLQDLKFGGVPYAAYCFLTDVSSLTRLKLGFENYFNTDDMFLEEILGQIVPAVQHVEELTLSDWCIEVLGAMEDKYMWNACKLLTIERMRVDYERIIDLLQSFPNLEMLALKIFKYETDIVQAAERNLPGNFLVHLRRVEIDWIEGDDLVFPFIELLLKHASKLQKMVFRASRIEARWTEEILGMPRSSPTAQVMFVEVDEDEAEDEAESESVDEDKDEAESESESESS